MESAVLSTANTSRFRTHQNPASVLWTSTLPKQRRRSEAGGSSRHHTLPRAAPHQRTPVCLLGFEPQHTTTSRDPPNPAHTVHYDIIDVEMSAKPNGVVKLKGTLAREVADAWGSRVGRPDQLAPKDRILSLFNDIELYPTEDQVSEMLVCARQCARRKSYTLTFSEFCVFAAELRRCSRQARQTQSKPGSPQRSSEKEAAARKVINGSEASPPPCEVFLGGSCNPTTWRSDIAIPLLKKMGITYFNPQVEEWTSDLLEVEHRAKASARAFLFVLDSETRAVATAVEAAHLAAAPRDLLLVLRPYARHQTIQRETMSDHEYVELSRARATLQEAVERRGLPAFKDIPAALGCARAVLRGARPHARHFGHTILRLKRAFDAAGGRLAKLPRPKAVDALRDITRAPRETAERCLPPTAETVDFDTFCAAVAELSSDGSDAGGGGVASRLRRALRSLRDRLTAHVECPRNGHEASEGAAEGGVARDAAADSTTSRDVTTLHSYNARLRACGRKLGLFIPKNGGNRAEAEGSGLPSGDSSAESVFTPGTERRLQRLPALLAAPAHDVYLGGAYPISKTRPEEILRREGFTYVIPRAVDYARMFSAPARRSAPAHPESPRTDKKPRPSVSDDGDVLYRDRASPLEPADRRSAPDFQSVVEEATPPPHRAAYDEEQLASARVLLFGVGGEAPNFATMVLAAHYVGLRPSDTVLLVQFMDPTQTQLYSEAAVKDYNRGRHYLADLARRAGVPVLDNTEDAVRCAVARLRAAAVPSSSTP